MGESFQTAHLALCQRLRANFEGQPFSCVMVALIVLMVEEVEGEFGEMAAVDFQNDLREAYKKVVRRSAN